MTSTIPRLWRLLAVTVLTGVCLAGALAQPPAAPDPNQAYSLANGLFDREHWEEALARYEEFIKAAPAGEQLPFALFRAGECHYNLQRFEKARPYYQRVVSDFPKAEIAADARYRLGDLHFRAGQFAEALAVYQALLEANPRGPLAFRTAYWLGETLYRLKRYPESVAAYERSLQLSADGPYAPYAAYSIALAKLKQGDPKDGTARLEALLQKHPKHELTPEIIYRLGEAQYDQKAYPAAIARYEQVLKEYPQSPLAPQAQAGIAWSHWSQEQYAEALAAFQQVQKSGDETLAREAALRVADCLYLLRRFDEAATAYGAIATQKDHPAAATALFWQAMALERKPDAPAAMKAFAQFVKDHPQHDRLAEAYVHLGALQVDAQQLAEAEQSYQLAAGHATDEDVKLQAQYGAAWAAYQRAQSPEALQAIEVLAEAQPKSALAAQITYQTGKLRLARQDYARAVQLFSALVDNHPQSPQVPETLYLLGVAYEKAGQVEKAQEFYQRAMTQAQGGEHAAEAAGALVALHAGAGNLAQARTALDSMAKNYPQSPSLPMARYALAEALFGARQYAPAAEVYQAIVAGKDPELAPYAQYSIGACRFALGEYQAAADAFRAAAGDYPQSDIAGTARYQLAVCLGRLKQPQEQAKLLEELLAKDPQGKLASEMLLELGWAQLEMNQPAPALVSFEKLLKQAPESPQAAEAAFRVGEIRYAQAEYPAAQAAYEQLLARHAASDLADEAEYKLGWALLKQEKPADALAHFQKAAAGASDPAVGSDARYQAALLLTRANQPEAAAKLLEPVQEQAPAELAPRLLLLLGQSYLSLKDCTRAAPVFQRFLTRFPDDAMAPRAMLGLGRCQKLDQKYDEATVSFTKVTGGKDSQAAMEAQFELAETRLAQKDYRGAAMEYLKVAILYSDAEWGARAQFAAGVCYEQAQAVEDAIKAYKVVVDRYKDQTEWAQKAADRLRALE